MIGAEVYLWGTRIGAVVQDAPIDIPRFNYDSAFLSSGIELSPIVMPLSDRVYSFPTLSQGTFHGLPGMLADSLPDKFGTKLIERYLTEQGRAPESFSVVERLCYVGSRGMGALEYVPAMELSSPDGAINIEALVKLASDVLTEKRSEHWDSEQNAIQQLIQVGTSAGGARAKAIIAWNEATGEVRSGQIDAGSGFQYWLMKFDGVENNRDHDKKADGPAYTRIEYAHYLMAKEAGITMAPCRLYQDQGHYHFLTRRFDRDPETRDKLHMQSLGALAHFDFNMPGAHGYEQAAKVIYQLGMGQNAAEQLFRRMVFGILARNHDDHVKNISFLMDRNGAWSLSPAYDVTYAYDPGNYWLARHQMSVNGKLEQFTLGDLLACARHFNLSKPQVLRIVNDIDQALLRFPSFAKEAHLSDPVIQKVTPNFIKADALE
ncbi:MAG: type II toxin-antitoxin system HipA family toxin [Clostridia bacterium]|nr:type II toxin-antitoxin system HipA family toxin [Clostridia bacterium]